MQLKKYRLKQKLKQKQVGDFLHISESAVCLHEKGLRTPSVELLKKYAKLYKCKIDDLIKE